MTTTKGYSSLGESETPSTNKRTYKPCKRCDRPTWAYNEICTHCDTRKRKYKKRDKRKRTPQPNQTDPHTCPCCEQTKTGMVWTIGNVWEVVCEDEYKRRLAAIKRTK